jgi:hypothetical protein
MMMQGVAALCVCASVAVVAGVLVVGALLWIGAVLICEGLRAATEAVIPR